MKLQTKLALFITLSKVLIGLLLVLSLPLLVRYIASEYTNNYLRDQQAKVLNVIKRDGVDFYLEGEKNYGSYTLLKEEFIALSEVSPSKKVDTIETTRRVIERDTLNYRVLIHSFDTAKGSYLLEIGKAISSISQYDRPLQRIALFVLMCLIVATLVIDLTFTRYLIAPLATIIKNKLISASFPFNQDIPAVKTTTTDFKYLDDSISTLMQQVNEAFQKEREFTANASHELMTPVSILQNKIENLMALPETSDNMQLRFMEMYRTLNRLKKIVNSLLLISRIENEQYSKTDQVQLAALLDTINEELSHRLTDKGNTISIAVAEPVVLKNVNQDLVFQLIYNVVNNAIKYNKPGGSIAIETSNTPAGLVLSVKDQGIGISEQDLPLIFNRFRKNQNAGFEGYGLGLSIVKTIALFHNIKITVTSAPGEGSAFMLLFPPLLVSQAPGTMETD